MRFIALFMSHKCDRYGSPYLINWRKTVITPKQIPVTIPAAIRIPKVTEGIALLGGMPKRLEIIAPVQAPVIGKGIPTKIAKPKNSEYSIPFAFLRLRSKSQSKNFFADGINLQDVPEDWSTANLDYGFWVQSGVNFVVHFKTGRTAPPNCPT